MIAASKVLVVPFRFVEIDVGGKGDTGLDVVLACIIGVPTKLGVPGLKGKRKQT